MKNTSIRDVAARAGTSTATVSRVLSGARQVSPSLTERVLKAVRETGFAPNSVASSLARGRSRSKGLLHRALALVMTSNLHLRHVDTWSETYYGGILEAADELDMSVSICTVEPEDLTQGTPPAQLLRAKCDGIIMQPVPGCGHGVIETIAPTVFVGSSPREGPSRPTIQADNVAGIAHVIDYLCGLNHRRFEFFLAAAGHRPYVERYECFASRLRERGLSAPAPVTHPGNDLREYARDYAHKPVPDRPTGLVCCSDGEAAGLLQALHACGVRVPAEASVVGFDGRSFGRACSPPLTTWAVDWHTLGRAAVRTVVEMAQGKGCPSDVRVGGKLLARGSAGPAPGCLEWVAAPDATTAWSSSARRRREEARDDG